MNRIELSRRSLLSALGALGVSGLAFAEPSASRRRVLVFVFLRGGIDGLSVIVPHGDPGYYAARKNVAIAQRTAIDLDGRFGLHPKLARLKPLWDQKLFAAVHAVGSPHPTRSHFDAQDYMETGTPGRASTADGWLGRALATSSDRKPLRAVALSERTPRSLSGPVPAVATRNLAAFDLKGPRRVQDRLERSFGALYAGDDRLSRASREALEAVRRVREVRRGAGKRSAPNYPAPARGLGEVAALIHADVGLEVAFVDVGGWDTHAGQGGADGQLARKLELLGRGLEAFRKDLGDRFEDVVVLAASEFGRTVAENGSGGTDHGHASMMLLAGGAVRGGKIHGRWPGLAREQLHEGRDLAVTTDFRDVFAEVLVRHLRVPRSDALFPGYGVDEKRFLGVIDGET
jgi:uncharacterized protein (DUF1501 family)